MDIPALNEYGPENDRACRYILVVIDNFSKLGETVPLQSKNAQSVTNSFKNILKSSKRKSKLIEKIDGSESVNVFSTNLLKKQ